MFSKEELQLLKQLLTAQGVAFPIAGARLAISIDDKIESKLREFADVEADEKAAAELLAAAKDKGK